MKVLGLSYASAAVQSIAEATENFQRLGLRYLGEERHERLGASVALFTTDNGAIALMEPESSDSPVASYLKEPGAGLYHAALWVDSVAEFAERLGGEVREEFCGSSLLVPIPDTGTVMELVSRPFKSASRGSAIERIESVPWMAVDAGKAEAELGEKFGLKASREYSDLWFPELGVKNRFFFTGDTCYLDINVPQSNSSPLARQIAKRGSGLFALALEPYDLDAASRQLRENGVPTLVEKPIDLNVQWHDGSSGSAARVLAVDTRFTHGARIFMSEPTFP